jgi:iron complex outermembrane receptor protein
LSLSAVQQSVVVNGGTMLGATPQPSQSDVFLSDQTLRVIDRTQMDMLGPVAGAAQVIALAPGARVTGYGNTGATKYTISINGINQGWGGYGGYTGGAALGITFDGIPIVDPATGLWQSATIPQMQIIQDTVVSYGPGDPLNRWYTNVGGAVEFTPLQPRQSVSRRSDADLRQLQHEEPPVRSLQPHVQRLVDHLSGRTRQRRRLSQRPRRLRQPQ